MSVITVEIDEDGTITTEGDVGEDFIESVKELQQMLAAVDEDSE